jgi:hypothetical protein
MEMEGGCLSNRLGNLATAYATAYGNGRGLLREPLGQPLYATLLSYPKQYATALGNRLWNGVQPLMEMERLTLLCGSSICQPFMEMAGKQSSNL